jgi:hypothetical protein
MRAFSPTKRSIFIEYVPSSWQLVDPAKISFLNSSTKVFCGHVPAIVTGDSLKCCPSVGTEIVAAMVGGFAGTVPDIPIDPASGPVYGVAAEAV